jgi:cyanophycin synthetase
MEILEIRAFDGPSIYSHKPVIRLRLALGAYAERPTHVLSGFTERLLAALPGLYEHHCSRGKCGGFVERLYEGTYLGHVIEHAALEIQALLGYRVAYGKVRGTGEDGVYDVVYAYGSKEGGLEAGNVAIKMVNAFAQNEGFDLATEIEGIKQCIAKKGLGPSTAAIYDAAEKRGIPVRRIGEGSILILGHGKKQKRMQATTTQLTGSIAVDIACDKALTKNMLAEAGIPVPSGGTAVTSHEAIEIARLIGKEVVVKPCDGSKGQGVTVRILAPEDVNEAFQIARQISEKVLVEEYIKGKQYRVLVVNGNVVAAAERIAARVIGDGSHTIQELINIANQDPARGEDHEKPLTKIKIDANLQMVLKRHGYMLQTVPAKGECVYLRDSANLSTGGTAVDVTDLVHPENVRLTVRAAQRIGLDVAGIDIVAADISKPIKKHGGAIIEINAAPGIRMHHFPSRGDSRDVADAIVDMLFPRGERGRIPLIAVTGTNGKTTTTRMIGHILSAAGLQVGMTTTDGVFIGKECIMEGDTTGPDSARAVLYDPTVEVAVLETARGGMLRGGLAFKECDIAIVTNVTEDHLGQDGIEDLEDLAHVKSLVVETVSSAGYAILNADDVYTMGMARACRGKVVLFSIEEQNRAVRRHLSVGGMAFFLREGYIICATGSQWEEVIHVAEIPVTFGGIATHNLQNAIMAIAAAVCQNVSVSIIKQALKVFAQNPGRLNLIEIENFRVMVDYGHNPAGYEALIRTLKQLNATRLVGVIAAPGDRRNDVIVNIGKIAGRGFDAIIIKEDKDLRGRIPEETAHLLRLGAAESGRAALDMKIILSEEEAVLSALENAQENDIIAICYEKYDTVMGVINDFCLKQRQASQYNDIGGFMPIAVGSESLLSVEQV